MMADAESAVATQIITEKIDLAAFLNQRKSLRYLSAAICPCDWPKQAAKRVIMFNKSILNVHESTPHNSRVLEGHDSKHCTPTNVTESLFD